MLDEIINYVQSLQRQVEVWVENFSLCRHLLHCMYVLVLLKHRVEIFIVIDFLIYLTRFTTATLFFVFEMTSF